MLLINDEQIAAAVSVKDCVEVMELAFKDLAAGEAVDTPRGRIFSGPAVKPGIYSIQWAINARSCPDSTFRRCE